ncbi:MAG: zinc-dependent alcohol dehydrogenase [Candidatus Humimicrobiaceae bacterium]
MKALVYLGPKKIKFIEANLPILNPGEVKIRIKACGICGSDIQGFFGINGRKIPPMIMGHEFSGIISEIGNGVSKFKIGDRVVAYPLIFCGTCYFCKNGLENLCINKKLYGVLDVNGAMAEYINVPEKLLFKLPENVSFIDATLVEPLAVACGAVYKIDNLEDLNSYNLLVIGSGTIGLLLMQILKDLKPLKLFVSDISDKRLEIAKELGGFCINPNKEDIYELLKKETGETGINISFEAVGISESVDQSILPLIRKGTSIWVGNSKPIIELNMQRVVLNEIKIIGSYAYSLNDFKTALNLLEKNKINSSIIINKIAKIEDGEVIFNELASGNEDIIKAVLTN